MTDDWDRLVHPRANGYTLASIGNWEKAAHAFQRDGHPDLADRCKSPENRRGLLTECRARNMRCEPRIPIWLREAAMNYYRAKHRNAPPDTLRQAADTWEQAKRRAQEDYGYNKNALAAITGEPG